MNRLERITSQKMIGGVAAGVAAYFNTDVALIRVLFVLGLIFGNAPFLLIYIILWVALPVRDESVYHQENAYTGPQPETAYTENRPVSSNNNSKVWGIVAIAAGAMFLLDEFTWWFSWHTFWPVLFILVGLAIIFKDEIREKLAQ